MEEYLREHELLIAEDRSHRVDADAFGVASDTEKQADQILRRIRAEEHETVWSRAAPEIPGAAHVFPGMEFLTARETILKTKLFRAVAKMPKGTLLHSHLDATVNARVLLNIALKHPAIHVRTSTRLTAETIHNVLPEFCPLPQDQWTSLGSLTDSVYEQGSGSAGFNEWAVCALTINPTEAYHTHNTTAKIWEKFLSTFAVARGLVWYMLIFVEYVREFFLSSIEDGILYIETRIPFWYKYMIGADGQENVPHREWLLVYDEVIAGVKRDLAAQGRSDEFVGSKIIYSAVKKDLTCEGLEWFLEDCIALKQEFPHLICGFDLVGPEDPLPPLINFIVPFQRFVTRQKVLDLDIPFILHAGETLGDGTAADMNLYDTILLGTKRIGHSFSLAKHPKLMELCRERNIAVEMCPISNEILRLTGSMPMHPLPILMNQGVPITLNSDDPAVFGNMGLSFDFFQVLIVSEVTGLLTVKALARDSLKHNQYTAHPGDTFIWSTLQKRICSSLACGMPLSRPESPASTHADATSRKTRHRVDYYARTHNAISLWHAHDLALARAECLPKIAVLRASVPPLRTRYFAIRDELRDQYRLELGRAQTKYLGDHYFKVFDALHFMQMRPPPPYQLEVRGRMHELNLWQEGHLKACVMAYHVWKSEARHCRLKIRELRKEIAGRFLWRDFARMRWERVRMKWAAVCAFKQGIRGCDPSRACGGGASGSISVRV
ncbi:Adenosine deaminase CECR1-A [Trametes pubescens]|uniref:adenosine deaminase n=1 Tax=Trametes pubescens TaxID=154538 RepID=A0A1M2W2M3_TRAPU|nr:Adenosine deaminase CECR1-A [Trametes pubescens]